MKLCCNVNTFKADSNYYKLYLPKTRNPRVQVKVAHSMSRVVSTLTTCLHTEGIPKNKSVNYHILKHKNIINKQISYKNVMLGL